MVLLPGVYPCLALLAPSCVVLSAQGGPGCSGPPAIQSRMGVVGLDIPVGQGMWGWGSCGVGNHGLRRGLGPSRGLGMRYGMGAVEPRTP